MAEIIFWSLCGIAVLAMAVYYMTRLKRLRSIFYGALTGIISLFLVNYFGGRFCVNLPLNIFNVTGSIILGIPFVICMVIFKLL